MLVLRSFLSLSAAAAAELPLAAADGGRDVGVAEFLVAQRGRRG